MIAALYSKNREEKDAFVRDFVRRSGCSTAVYFYPKNRSKEVPVLPGVYSVSYEDVTKRDVWLHINSIVGPASAIVFENPSRYPKITSTKFGHLKRLSMQVEHKALVDIVPFTLDVKYLYTPLAYLDRAILGHAHYYAFRENYYERGADGVTRSAHDFDVLARKMRDVCAISYDAFLCRDRQTVRVESTTAEHEAYQTRKSELFAVEKSPQRIITRLADTVHAFDSRLQSLLSLLPTLAGDTIIYTNLGTYAKRVQTAVREAGHKRAWAVSYQTGSTRHVDNCIYFESPIVKSYYLLDAESRLRPSSSVYHFLGDTKVDAYLYDNLDHELQQINGLTKELYRETHN